MITNYFWKNAVDLKFNIIDPEIFASIVIEEVTAIGFLSVTSRVRELFDITRKVNRGTNSWKEVEKILNEDFPLVCPKEGSFIGYKKGFKRFITDELYTDDTPTISYEHEDVLITLDIPAEAKRSSAFGRKCRCSEAKVLDIVGMESGKHYKSAQSYFDNRFWYFLGKIMSSDGFDENRWRECSNGIHFFMTEDEARNYKM